MTDKWKDWIFPPRCPVCDRVMTTGERICPICRSYNRPERIRDPFCMKCGKPLERSEREYCRDCITHPPAFDQGRAAFAYRGMESAMHRFKNRGRQEYAGFYGEEMASEFYRVRTAWRPQVIVPIPIHWTRRRSRGYNQAELLCREIAGRTRIPVDNRILLRCRRTRFQRSLNDQERSANLKNAFIVRGEECRWERILLVDDIYTTGSTMNEAAQTLLRAGAGRVYCLSACIGKGY